MKVNRIPTLILFLLFIFSTSYAQKNDTPWYKKTLSEFGMVYFGFSNDIEKQTIPIYVVMPKLNLEIKITNYMKFGWGLSYRMVKGVDIPWSSNSNASNFGYHGTFKFGNFGK